MNIALQYQATVDFAVHSKYSRSNFFDKDSKLRLATEAINRGQIFADTMDEIGHTYKFASKNDEAELDADEEDANEEPEANIESDFEDDKLIDIRRVEDHPDLDEIVCRDGAVSKPSVRNILFWLKEEYRGSRGFELGTFDPSLLAVTLKCQASKWRALALGYISDVVTLVHSFIMRAIEHFALTSRVQDGLKARLIERLEQHYRAAMDHAKFLIKVELEGTPSTLNHYFNDELQKR